MLRVHVFDWQHQEGELFDGEAVLGLHARTTNVVSRSNGLSSNTAARCTIAGHRTPICTVTEKTCGVKRVDGSDTFGAR